jgi:YfiH family protein
MLTAPNLAQFSWLTHGFGTRESEYPAGIATLRQIHSGIVIEVSQHGADRFAEGDALIAREQGDLIGVRTADCVPILIADSRTHAVAAVHAGWRGSAVRIVENTVARMRQRYHSRPEDLHAAIGPAIGGCCYEVGPDVARQFGTDTDVPVKIDLAAINARQLSEAGVRDVWKSGRCTFCEAEHWFSYRREKEAAGRMVSFIGSHFEAEERP